MIVNLWTTPRTGSNWYSQYLFDYYQKINPNVILYQQYLNSFHFRNYIKPNYTDYVYTYEPKCVCSFYHIDPTLKIIIEVIKRGPRHLNPEEEEKYRLDLLTKHDRSNYTSIFYSHVLPMSSLAYNTLFGIADKNIFLYRKDIKRQLSSYALAYGTKQYKPLKDQIVYENVNVAPIVLENLMERIIHWHRLDKTGCDIISYEELDFENNKNHHERQNFVDPFTQLDTPTQESILKLEEYFKHSV